MYEDVQDYQFIALRYRNRSAFFFDFLFGKNPPRSDIKKFINCKKINMNLKLIREKDNGTQCTGAMQLRDEFGKILFSMKTLELPWKDNKRNISCIPCGWYLIKKRYSIKYGWHLHVCDVKNRDYILIHSGNYFFDTLGCILVGDSFKKINKDLEIDITNSKKTMKILLSLISKQASLKIENSKYIWLK